MEIRFYIDSETGEPHIHRHAVDETEVEDILSRPWEDRPGQDDSRVALGQTRAGRYFASSTCRTPRIVVSSSSQPMSLAER